MSNLTDEQIDCMLSAMVLRPVGNDGESVKNGRIRVKTPLELQMNVLCCKMRNSKLPVLSSENRLESIFENVESILGKDKVGVPDVVFSTKPLRNILNTMYYVLVCCSAGVHGDRPHVRYPIRFTRFGGRRTAVVGERILLHGRYVSYVCVCMYMKTDSWAWKLWSII